MRKLSKPLLCLSHRGGSQTYTENTLAAFKDSLELGVDGIELDVWAVDGELLVTHDRRLGKTLPGEGRVLDYSAKELRAMVLPCGQHIATLAEVLTLVGNQALLNIELKGPDCADLVAEQLLAFQNEHRLGLQHYVVSSFDHRQLMRFKQRLPDVRLGALVEGIPLHYAAFAEELGAFSLNASLNFIEPEFVEDAHRRGLQVWVYTVNAEEDMHWMADMGVDGIFTDYPQRLLALNPDRDA